MSAPQARIALVAREVSPLFGGGIGTFVAAMAEVLEPVGEVTVFTTDRHMPAYEQLLAAGDARVAAMRIRFVAEPRAWEVEDYHDNGLHLWSARVFEALCAEYPEGGPDLVEFPDFLGEGFVTAQAARSLDPRLRRTTVCVRTCTTAHMTDVLNGHLPAAFDTRVTYEMERYALAHCDHVLWPGGDVLASYRRVYGDDAVADPLRIRHPLAIETAAPAPRAQGDGLRLLYLGRLERRKGLLDLARAITGVEAPNLRLTIAGGDTTTAPLGQSMRRLLELMLGGDARVAFADAVAPDRVAALFDAHDLVLMPSLWECWPAVGMEALARNRPLLATPTGGFSEIVEPGRSGWLTEAPGAEPLARALEQLAAAPEQVSALSESGEPRAKFGELNDLDQVRDDYAALVDAPPARTLPSRTPAQAPPLVSIVVPYYRLARHVEATVRSAAEQTHSRIELIVINDGSFDPPDAILSALAERYSIELITQPNSGLGAARNLGATQARGRYVLFLDADNVAHPTLVERCVAVLEADSSLAYATSWARYIDERGEQWGAPGRGLRPLGNWSELTEERNVAGDAAAVFRRELFDRGLRFSQELTSFEDWAVYRLLRREGQLGHVIPEALLDYRIRDDSMMRRLGARNAERIEGEVRAHLAEAAIEWTMQR